MTDFTPKFYPRELHFSLNKWIVVNPHNEGMHAHPSGAAVCCLPNISIFGYVAAGGVEEKIQCDACGVVLLWTNHSFPLPFECI